MGLRTLLGLKKPKKERAGKTPERARPSLPEQKLTERLIAAEVKYGGYVSGVTRRRVSALDLRTPEQVASGGMTGGDRMHPEHHGYAPAYSQFLLPFFSVDRPVIVEIGILRGTGLAIWSDLFRSARIVGMDIDLSHFRDNEENLRRLGAFTSNNVEVHEFDQYASPEDEPLRSILGTDRVNICIDDGIHSDSAILNSIERMRPFLADNFVYFIEDNSKVHTVIRGRYGSEFAVTSHGQMTVLHPLRLGA